MRVMAGRTQRLREGLMPVFGSQRLLRLRMTAETKVVHFCNEQVVVLRGMRPVAGETALLARDRRMSDNERFPFVRMTTDAELISALCQEPRIFRRVRIVALNAHSLFERHMLVRPACFEIFTHMTLRAEVADGAVRQRKGFFRVRGSMTHVTTRRHDRVVRARLQEFRLIRGVRVVAHHAGLRLNGIVAMRRFKSCFIAVMARQTER